MDLYRTTQTVLRSSEPLLPFLVPSLYRPSHPSRAGAVSRHCRTQQPHSQIRRAFSTTHIQQQQAAAQQYAPSDPEPEHTSREYQDSTATRGGSDDISSLLDSALDFSKGTPTASAGRTSHFKANNASGQRNNVPNYRERRGAEGVPERESGGGVLGGGREGGNSVQDLLDSMAPPPQRAGRSNDRSSLFDISSMLDPLNNTRPPPPALNQTLEKAPMKLGPTAGRTINVNKDRGMDVGRAFRQLEIQCARNAVRRDFMRQRFHERPGMKRKRLHSERWRRRFKAGFRETVRLVQKMRGQGW